MGKSLEVVAAANARIAKQGANYAIGKGAGYDFGARHEKAFHSARAWRYGSPVNGGAAVAQVILAAASYADAHQNKHETPVGHDYVLGEGFASILQGARTLLNGDMGNLDCGTLDAMILDIASVNGIDPDTWELGKDVGTYADTHKPETR
jgi:hypothetical protein